MQFQALEPIPPVPSNYTDSELVSHVRHYFPNLTGPLKVLVDRFESKASKVCFNPPAETGQPDGACPNCGTKLKVQEVEEQLW